MDCHLSDTHVIADVGSGTGILTELFLKNGNTVIGVEPDPTMRAGAKEYLKDFPNFVSLAGSAEATALPDQSVDSIAVGQAFHWFDLKKTRPEFKRILKPGGWVVLVWNGQRVGGTPFLDELQRFWEDERFTKRSSSQSHARQEKRAQTYRLNPGLVREELLDPFFGPGEYVQKIFDNPLYCDLDGLKGRILSNALALEPDDQLYSEMLEAIEKIFTEHQVNGMVTIEHDTRVVYGQLF